MIWIGLAGIVLLIGIILLVDWWRIGGVRERDRRSGAQGASPTGRKVV